MNKRSTSKSGFFSPRIFLGFVLCSAGASLGFLAFGAGTPASPVPVKSRNLSMNAAGAVSPVVSRALRELPTITQLTTTQTEIGDTERRLVGRQVQDPSVHDPVVKSAAAA